MCEDIQEAVVKCVELQGFSFEGNEKKRDGQG